LLVGQLVNFANQGALIDAGDPKRSRRSFTQLRRRTRSIPQPIERIEPKLDRFLGRLHNLIRVNADGTSAEPSKLTSDERKKRSESCCRHLHKFATSSEKTVIQHWFSRSGANSTTKGPCPESILTEFYIRP
jgi:hypothetical protein